MWIGITLMALAFFALLGMLSIENVSFVVPVTALSYAAGALGGKFFLGERVTPQRWAGVALVCVGVALVFTRQEDSRMTGWVLIRDALLLLALAPFAYYLIAIFAAVRFFCIAASCAFDFLPPVSILKPIRGLDREAYENYASFCRQDYPEFEILFCVTDEQDPAIPVIEQIIRDFPTRPIRLLIGSEPLGASDKVNKLCRMVREARNDILIVSDSDVRVEPGFLARGCRAVPRSESGRRHVSLSRPHGRIPCRRSRSARQ